MVLALLYFGIESIANGVVSDMPALRVPLINGPLSQIIGQGTTDANPITTRVSTLIKLMVLLK